MKYETKTIKMNGKINRNYVDIERSIVTNFSDYTDSSNSLRDKFKINVINLIIQYIWQSS